MKKRTLTFVISLLIITLLLSSCGFSYNKGDLSKYADWNFSDFSNFKIEIDEKWEITEEDIQEALHLILLERREEVDEGKLDVSHTIEDADDVALYYLIEKEDGTYVSDGYDVGASKMLTLTIGSKTFVYSGVEEALVGLVPSDYSLHSAGYVSDEDTIFYLKYSYTDLTYDENHNTVYVSTATRFDRDSLSKTFASNFYDCMLGAELGTWFSYSALGDYLGTGETVERSFQVMVCSCAKNEFTFSLSDGSVFHAQLLYSVDYALPEYTDAFVTETLGIYKDSSSPKADLENEIRSILEEDDDRVEAIEAAFWEQIREYITIHSLPPKKVKEMKKVLEYELQTLYDYYKENYYHTIVNTYGEESMKDLYSFVKMLYQDKDRSGEEIIEQKAKTLVEQDLILFILKEQTNLISQDEETKEKINEIIESYMTSSGYSRKKLLSTYGSEEYFESIYLYKKVISTLQSKDLISYK